MDYKSKLDRIFSEFIRLRDSDARGYGRCISCGRIVHWKDADAGHYVNRKHMSLRYDETNVNLQCRACNRYDEGNMIGYHHGLVKKYGEGAVELLNIRRHNSCRLGKTEYETLIRYYGAKVRELKSQKD